MPMRNATGVVCKFFIWGIDIICMVLLSERPLTVTCAGVSVLCNQILDSMALLGGSSVQYCVAVRVQTFPL
jgi:hypothetical protein